MASTFNKKYTQWVKHNCIMSLNMIVYLIILYEATATCVGEAGKYTLPAPPCLTNPESVPPPCHRERVKHVPHENQTTVSQWNNPYPSHNMAELNCTVGYWLCPDEQCPSLWLPRLLAPLQWWTTCNQLRSKEHFNSTRIWKLVFKHSQFSVC